LKKYVKKLKIYVEINASWRRDAKNFKVWGRGEVGEELNVRPNGFQVPRYPISPGPGVCVSPENVPPKGFTVNITSRILHGEPMEVCRLTAASRRLTAWFQD